MSDQNIRI